MTKKLIRNSASEEEQDVPGGGAVEASEARMVHVRPGRLPSTETSLALSIDRPRAEDPRIALPRIALPRTALPQTALPGPLCPIPHTDVWIPIPP